MATDARPSLKKGKQRHRAAAVKVNNPRVCWWLAANVADLEGLPWKKNADAWHCE
jgi:hypothetical protein